MIDQTFLHFPKIGPATERKLKGLGYANWQSLVEKPDGLPFNEGLTRQICEKADACRRALDNGDIDFLTRSISNREHWRILAHFFDQASYFDIETSGLDWDDHITVIACYHRGALHTFIQGENLDDFLDFMDDIRLLVSFNGSGFDVPHLLRHWHIPEIPCAHIDLRWQCYHCGFKGGLKRVEKMLEIQRPSDLVGVDGYEAVWLWHRWRLYKDETARDKLVRYCAADVLSLPAVAMKLLEFRGLYPAAPTDLPALWKRLREPWFLQR